MKLTHIFNKFQESDPAFPFSVFKAHRTTWKNPKYYFVVVGKAPISGFYGYDNFGEACSYDGNEEDWEIVDTNIDFHQKESLIK